MASRRYSRCGTRVRCAFAALIAGAAQIHAVAQLAPEPAACTPEEQTVFACSTGSKRIAVCASPGLTETAGAVQYRFGPPAAAELVIPAAGDDWRSVTRAGGLTFSGGGGAFLVFAAEPFRYVVYSASGRGWGRKAGVVVEKAGKRVASLACKGKVVSVLGPDFFSAAGIQSANGSFDLP